MVKGRNATLATPLLASQSPCLCLINANFLAVYPGHSVFLILSSSRAEVDRKAAKEDRFLTATQSISVWLDTIFIRCAMTVPGPSVLL